MFKKVLIANRGLVAANCVRAVRELGAKVAVTYELQDLNSVAVRTADEALEIRTQNGVTAYLDVDVVVDAAVRCGADAVHPGYGFLARNKELADRLKEKGIALIAQDLGAKPQIKEAARQAGLAVLPGTGILHNWNDVDSAALSVGYPLVVKALASYAGWGVRMVRGAEELRGAWDYVCKQCAKHGVSQEVILEKYLPGARQVEFPVLRDRTGRVLVLPELDTTVQRRFQKLLVESPSPAVKSALRGRLEAAIPALVSKLNLVGCATVEFLVADDEAYLIDVDGGAQAAYSVTGMLTGLNLLREQIRVHSGEALRVQAEHIQRKGHALGVFLYAMDPYRKFAPSPGRVERFQIPAGEGVVLQAGVAVGDLVSPQYDPLIAKLLVVDSTRDEAIGRLRGALEDCYVEGVRTNLPIMRAIVASSAFVKAEMDISSLFSEETRLQLLRSLRNPKDDEVACLVAALALNTDANAAQILETAQQGSLLWSMASRILNRKKMEF